MKTTVSIPDPLFARAEQLARKLGKSRSQLYRDALEEYLGKHDPDEVTQSWNRVCEELGGPDELERAWLQQGEQTLRGVEWDEEQ